MVRAEVRPASLRWMRDRGETPAEVLTEHVTKLSKWEQGTSKTTLKQVQALAQWIGTQMRGGDGERDGA